MKNQLQSIKKVSSNLIRIWLPKTSLSHDSERQLITFIGIQFTSGLMAIGMAILLWFINTPKLATVISLYSVLCLLSIICIRLNLVFIGQVIGGVNVATTLFAGAVLLGRQGSVWVYFIGTFVGNHFFIAHSVKLRKIGDFLILASFGLFLIVDWLQLVPTEITPANQLAVTRFGIFNILYALVIMTGFVGYFHKKSMEYREELEQQTSVLKEQLFLVSSILNNMKQSIFAIGPQKTVVPPVSKFTEAIFPNQIEGKNINEVLFAGKTTDETCSKVNSTLDLVFGEDELNWQMLRTNLPPELDVDVEGKQRKLKVSYSDMRSEDGNLEKVLLVVEDITAMRELEEQFRSANEARDREMKIVEQVYLKDTQQLESFFKNTERLLTELQATFDGDLAVNERVTMALRLIHTIKGNARAMGFGFLSAQAHEIESLIDKNRSMNAFDEPRQKELFKQGWESISGVTHEYLAVTKKFNHHDHGSVLSTKGSSMLVFGKSDLHSFEERVMKVLKENSKLTKEQWVRELGSLGVSSVS
jgi:hypothetical protein